MQTQIYVYKITDFCKNHISRDLHNFPCLRSYLLLCLLSQKNLTSKRKDNESALHRGLRWELLRGNVNTLCMRGLGSRK